jgi:rubrerythrin
MERFSIIEVIEQAIQTEGLGHEFYNKMASRFKDHEQLQRLFDTLALKELQHKNTFIELKDMTGEDEPEGWEEVKPYFRAMTESAFFLGRFKSLPSMEGIRTPADALRLAINFEKETILYFLGMRDAVKEREVVDEIIREERSHIVWLSRLEDEVLKG